MSNQPANSQAAAMPVCGPYRAIEMAGTGATAIVYRAEHVETKQIVALKVIKFDQSNIKLSRRLKKLFATEAALSMKVKHAHIIEIFAAEIEENIAWIAMEFIDGVSLRTHCSFDNLLPPHRVVEIMFKCAMGLDFAARRGVVHRDIKPDNIMIGSGDVVKIADFGLALDTKKKNTDSTFIMGVGSPAYMSPEQIKDYPLNGQTDIYSLGAVMYELLTGRQPFRAKNRAALMYKIINMDAEPVSTLNPSVPDTLDPIIKRALEKDLYTRYRSGVQMAQDLTSAKFQILDDADSIKLTKRFKILRTCPAFLHFENDEIWEVMRISFWRSISEGRPIMKEDEEGGNFGVVIEGEVEVSLKGKHLTVLKAGDPVGELAFLMPTQSKRMTTVVAVTDVVYLEVSAAAYAIASEECQEHFRKMMVETLMKRTREANEKLIESAPIAMGIRAEQDFGLDLVPLGQEYAPADDSAHPVTGDFYRPKTQAQSATTSRSHSASQNISKVTVGTDNGPSSKDS